MKIALIFVLVVLPALVSSLGQPNPKGSGRGVTGGWGKPHYDWTFGKDRVEDLQAKIKAGNVYIWLHGTGTIELTAYWYVGDNTTIDGDYAQITFKGPKGLYVSRTKNIIITGLCFTENETAVNMSGGGSKLWVHRNSFTKSVWGSPIALSGYGCTAKMSPEGNVVQVGACKNVSTEISISNNRFQNSTYGPLMFLGVNEASFYNNVWRQVQTRIPRAQNQGTFHLCNNLFESWALGFQGNDGAKFIYENNIFNRYDATVVNTHGDTAKLGNAWIPNPKERIDLCIKNLAVQGKTEAAALKDGPPGGVKMTCDFKAPYPTDCPAIQGSYDSFARSIDYHAGVAWCKI